MSDVKDANCHEETSVPVILKEGIKRIPPFDFPKYVPVHMTHHYRKFQTRWSVRILRDWWRCQLMRGTHDPHGKSRDDLIPEFVYGALTWLLQCDVHDWSASGVRWKVSQMYDELEFASFDYRSSCVKVKGPVCLDLSYY